MRYARIQCKGLTIVLLRGKVQCLVCFMERRPLMTNGWKRRDRRTLELIIERRKRKRIVDVMVKIRKSVRVLFALQKVRERFCCSFETFVSKCVIQTPLCWLLIRADIVAILLGFTLQLKRAPQSVKDIWKVWLISLPTSSTHSNFSILIKVNTFHKDVDAITEFLFLDRLIRADRRFDPVRRLGSCVDRRGAGVIQPPRTSRLSVKKAPFILGRRCQNIIVS